MAAKKRTGTPGWDRPAPKVRADAKLKNLAAEDQETLWILLHPTDSTVPAYTLEAAMAYVLEEYDLSVAKSVFSEWHAWYALNLRMDAAEQRALQSKERYARQNPTAALQELEDYAQFVFTSETLENQDALNFGRLKKLRLVERTVEQKDQVIALKEREVAQKDEVIAQADRKLKMLEAKAQRMDALEAKAKEIKAAGGLSPETLEVIEKQLKLL